MRVGVDATSWLNPRGYGRFARNAIGRLVELDGATSYVLYLDPESAAHATLPRSAEIREVGLSTPAWRAATASSSRSVRDLLRLARAVRRDRLDVFLFPSIYTYFPVVGVPTVVGIHDVIADQFPELTMSSRRARVFWHAKQSLAVRRAAALFTVSDTSRAAIADRLGIAHERVAVVPEAPDPIFSPRDTDEVARALTALGLASGRPFLVFAGGISPHKNIETLLEAHARLKATRNGELPVLVLVGDLENDPYVSAASTLRSRIAVLGVEQSVHLPGFVSDETLACLYSGAAAVVLPSLAEGFGLPAVEAAACGAPLLLSDIPAHRETLGDAAVYFPPRDVDALVRAVEHVLTDVEFGQSLAERGRAAVRRLSWDDTAARLGELLVATARR